MGVPGVPVPVIVVIPVPPVGIIAEMDPDVGVPRIILDPCGVFVFQVHVFLIQGIDGGHRIILIPLLILNDRRGLDAAHRGQRRIASPGK